jgi:hypothetical protein
MSLTYKKETNASNHAPDVILLHKSEQISILTIADEVPKVGQGIQKIANCGMIVRFAIVGGKPASGSRGQQRAVGPAIWVHRVN